MQYSVSNKIIRNIFITLRKQSRSRTFNYFFLLPFKIMSQQKPIEVYRTHYYAKGLTIVFVLHLLFLWRVISPDRSGLLCGKKLKAETTASFVCCFSIGCKLEEEGGGIGRGNVCEKGFQELFLVRIRCVSTPRNIIVRIIIWGGRGVVYSWEHPYGLEIFCLYTHSNLFAWIIRLNSN